jgi:hypothetical protein
MGILVTSAQASGESELSAREHFERGVEASRQGDLVRALEHFESAQSLNPNPTVLYNLGQTYTALGRPVEALQAFRAYLEMSPGPSDGVRRREVEELIRKNEEYVGTLVVEVDPPEAHLEIDGRPAEANPAHEVRAKVGRRLLTATYPGYRAVVLPLDVKSGEARPVKVALEREAAEMGGFIAASCNTPSVAVFLDDEPVAPAKLAQPLAVTSGEHRVRFERRGYRPSEASVVAAPNATARIHCALVVDPELPAHQRAELRVGVEESGALVTVDGSPFRGGELPLGLHLLEVTAPGYRTFRKTITLRGGAPARVAVDLTPTAERRLAEHAHTRRLVTYSLGGAGLLLGGLATTLFITNQNRYEEWDDDRKDFFRQIADGGTTPEDAQRLLDLQDRAASIQRRDDVAIGTAVLGGVLLSASIVLWLTDDSTDGPSAGRASAPLQVRF